MEYEGLDIKPWKDGKFRCPWKCHEGSGFPGPKWSTEKGFTKHLDSCSFNPKLLERYKPEPVSEVKVKFGTCSDCGRLVWKMQTIWQMLDRWVCFECADEYAEAGNGFNDCAGLELPKVMLEGF